MAEIYLQIFPQGSNKHGHYMRLNYYISITKENDEMNIECQKLRTQTYLCKHIKFLNADIHRFV